MAAKAIRPRSGLQPGVVQRHERRHAGSKDAPRAAQQRPTSAQRSASVHHQRHPPTCPPGARTARPPRPQQRHPRRQPRRAVPPTWPSGAHRAPPAAPTAAPTAPDTWSPATQQASPGARNERPRALSSVQRPSGGVICTTERHQQRPQQRPQRHPRPTHSPTSGYHRAPSSRATVVPTERSPHRSALPRISRATGNAHHVLTRSAQQAPSAAPTERQSPRPQQRPSAAPSRALSSANRAGYVVTSHATSATRSAQRSALPLTSRTHRAPTGALAATTSVSQCRTSAAPAVRPAPSHATRSAHRVIPSRAIGSATARMPSVSGKKTSEDAESKPDPAAAGLEDDRFFTASGGDSTTANMEGRAAGSAKRVWT
nr:serine/arginine repetitive matrix protein 1-like [Drosophila suzukii]